MEIYKLTVEELLTLFRDGKLKVEEVINVFKERINKIDENVKAFISVLEPDTPEIDAKLSGIPYALKDNILAKGTRTTCASKILENYFSVYDATVTKKLKDSGAILIGKTNLDEFAMGSSTENSAFFTTRNPWDLSRIAGGSSGGSAAAVACREVPFSLGSDTGGSVRLPAAFCGVIGFKPSYGLVSRYGLVAFGSSLDQIGPITHSVRDTALITQLIYGKDPNDSTTVDIELDFLRDIEEGMPGMKFALPKQFLEDTLDDEIANALKKLIKILESNGGKVEEVDIPSLKYVVAVYYIIAPAEASSNLARYDGIKYGLRSKKEDLNSTYISTRGEGFGEEVIRRIMLGTFTLSAAYYDAYFDKAQKVRTIIKNSLNEIFEKYDAIISPTSPVVAPKIGEIKDPLTYYLMDLYTIPANLAGLPAVSIPIDFQNGLPIGIQIMGKRFEDPKVLRIARSVEKALDILDETGHLPVPEF
ncbi:MAG: aspartyl-tRNA(Asn)/glutamyl-tRNA(Gln) amidotransferase subunit [Thermotogaceae bacterium]|nr:aspartyl-tRNA(Asn)/glutamyl-tRNA(Gln) amidotransferase subunit [Thermotogaceae bacterium]